MKINISTEMATAIHEALKHDVARRYQVSNTEALFFFEELVDPNPSHDAVADQGYYAPELLQELRDLCDVASTADLPLRVRDQAHKARLLIAKTEGRE